MNRFDLPPTAADLELLAREAFETVPEALRAHCRDVVIRIEEFPDEGVAREMELESPFDLLGLYQGVSLDRRSIFDVVREPEMIFLYRVPLLCCWVEYNEDLSSLVRHVMIHEIGHHFGLSDEEMEALENQS